MIKEFFEDRMGSQLSEEQKERLEIAFAKTNVMFENLEKHTNGVANHIEDSISISTRHLNNPSKTILFLLHEYGHILSLQNLKKDNFFENCDIEEGIQDVFSELVTNHYLEKHEKIEIDGKRVRMEYPCKSFSSYDNENSWARSMLYPLQKQCKDIEAVTEYLLGNKNRFLEMTLGKENADKKPCDLFGNKSIDVSLEEIYAQMPEKIENEDMTGSIYGRRNNFLPIFIMQKKLEGTDINFFGLKENVKYNCDYVANKYFGGRRIYEISREEIAEFYDLYESQKGCVIHKYDDFLNKMINELTEEEIAQYSREILDSLLALTRNVTNIGTNLEYVWSRALTNERQKAENGQSVITTTINYRKFINDYMTFFSGIKDDTGEFLLDGVKDLKDSYLQQMEENIKSGNLQEVLDGLRNDDGTICVDADILRLFEILKIKFEQVQLMGSCYTTQDIVESAIREKLKLDDVKKISIILENEKDNKLVGERENGE